MSFFGSLLSMAGAGAGILALDTFAALLNGPKPKQASQLKNKAFRSDAYGTPHMRCRGTVRCQGKDIWGTPIITSIWKTTSGGLFGLGQTSVNYNKYSQSRFISFGKKLGGGAAAKILRIWADGKLLFNSVASDGAISGTVTVSTVSGGQLTGAQTILFDLASGATLKLNPGDSIEVPGDPGFTYVVQLAVNSTGVAASVPVTIWPPLRVDLVGGGALTVVGANSSPYDLSSFDPNPHDGSHKAGGYDCPPGGIRFYLGSDTQQPDPAIVKQLGVGNVPGYRGLVGCVIHDLQLANYGDHPPQITAEVAYDTATNLFPITGPTVVPNFGALDGFATPTSGASSLDITNPLLSQVPFLFIFMHSGPTRYLARVNTQTNDYEAEVSLIPLLGAATFWLGIIADSDGYVYINTSAGSWTNYKIDGRTLTLAAAVTSGITDPSGMSLWDGQQSLFGNSVTVKGFVLMGSFGGIEFYDRNTLQPFGVANPLSAGTVCVGYDKSGNPLITAGDSAGPGTPYTGSGAEMAGNALCVDADGNIWGGQKDKLSKYNGQFTSSIDIPALLQGQIKEYLAAPSFARTDYSVSAVSTLFIRALYYNAADNSIIIFGDAGTGKFDIKTSTLIAIAAALDPPCSEYIDLQGTIMCGAGSLTRFDVNTMQVVATYGISSFTTNTGAGNVAFGTVMYDALSDSVYWQQAFEGNLYRGYLDRANGLGIGLDSIIASIMSEAGYDASQYDVTQLTTAGQTVVGAEFESESYLDSLRKAREYKLFDAVPIDGKIVFIPRGQASVATIPEDDLGALSEPDRYEARVIETIQDPLDTPEKFRVHYYDPLKNSQPAVQEAKRISKPYASTLSTGKAVTNSRQQADISTPFTDTATAAKQQAEILVWDAWTGRTVWKFKLGPKYVRLTTGDVITVIYKSISNVMRIEELNYGASGAVEITARLQDASVYSSAHLPISSGGLGSGVSNPQPPVQASGYTVSPTYPLSEVSATDIHMVDVTAIFNSGARTLYNARDFTVSDPGAGNSQLYYVTILDPDKTGEVPGTVSLTALCETTPTAAFLGNQNYIFIGTILITHDLTGVVVTSGGSDNINQAEGFYVNGGGTGPFSTKEDLINYVTMDSRRASFHLEGVAANARTSKIYSYLDPTTNSIAQIKTASGNPWDIQLFDGTYIYQFITELDDAPTYPDWSVATSYKKYVISHGYPTAHALPIMPRYWTPGQAPTTIVVPSPNNYNRYRSCAVIDTINRGQVTCVTRGAMTMNFDSEGDGAGNLGDVQVVIHERYAGNSRERFYWARGLGFVKWEAATLVTGAQITGTYKVTNWSVHNKLVAGGGVSPNFPCGYGAGWP